MTLPRKPTTNRRGALRLAGALAAVALTTVESSALAQTGGGMPGMGTAPGSMAGGAMPPMAGMEARGMHRGMQMMMPMMNELMGPDSDRTFIREMIPHHQSAVAMATVGWQQAEHPEVKQLAEQIVRAQNGEIEQMAALYRAWFNAPVPPGQMAMMSAQIGMTGDALMGAKPSDKLFLEMMSMHHQMAVMMAIAALPSAQHDELAKIQQQIVEDQAKEIVQVRSWRRAWYGA